MNSTIAAQPLAQLHAISKIFFTEDLETHALSQIDLDIYDGDFLSISGPSGCGKSTLLSILGLLDTPTEGTYTLGERPVAKLSLSERARIRNREIGFIFQSFNLIGDLTVYEKRRAAAHLPQDGALGPEEPGGVSA